MFDCVPSGKSAIYGKLIWIFFFAFTLRVAVRWHAGAPDFWENGYTFFFVLAQNIAAGTGFAFNGTPTAFRVPLYPIFLMALTLGQQYFSRWFLLSLLSARGPYSAQQCSREIFGNTAAFIAATLTAVYPYYVVHDTALQETSLYTFLIALAVLLMLRVRRSGLVVQAIGAGLTLGAAVLTRANLAPFAIFAPLWLALAGGSSAMQWRRRLPIAIVCAAVGLLTLAPWLIRVYQLTGSVTLSTGSGFFLWVGNNPYTFSRYPDESIDRSQADALKALSSEDKSELDSAAQRGAPKTVVQTKGNGLYVR